MKKRITALALAFVMVLGTAALAAGTEKSISVTPMDMTINGQAVTPTKSNGEAAEVFAYDGATYVPLRYLSELLGIEVVWDKDHPNTATLVMDKMTYTATTAGHNAPITVAVTMDGGKIAKVEVPTENETIGVGKVAIEKMAQRIVETQSLACDSITGASITSAAIKRGAIQALKDAGVDTTELTKAPAKAEAKDAVYDADVVVVGGGGARVGPAV